jgi:hypothetical protein
VRVLLLRNGQSLHARARFVTAVSRAFKRMRGTDTPLLDVYSESFSCSTRHATAAERAGRIVPTMWGRRTERRL